MSSFERCADALIQAAKQRNTSLRAAMDLIPGSLLTDTFRAYAEKPQTCVGGGFASGGSKIRSGHGSFRRILDVEKFLKDVADYRDRKPKEAA
jgi:hypothetical protein